VSLDSHENCSRACRYFSWRRSRSPVFVELRGGSDGGRTAAEKVQPESRRTTAAKRVLLAGTAVVSNRLSA
jgi:hypothetical protein